MAHIPLEKDRRSFLTTDQPYYGPQERTYSNETAAAIDEEIKRIIDEAFARTIKILNDRKDTLDRIARRLLEKETLDKREMAALTAVKQVAAPRHELGPIPKVPTNDGQTTVVRGSVWRAVRLIEAAGLRAPMPR